MEILNYGQFLNKEEKKYNKNSDNKIKYNLKKFKKMSWKWNKKIKKDKKRVHVHKWTFVQMHFNKRTLNKKNVYKCSRVHVLKKYKWASVHV